MSRQACLSALVLLLAGCAVGSDQGTPLPPSHPASASAQEASYTPPVDVLRPSGSPTGESVSLADTTLAKKPADPVKVEGVSAETRKTLEQILESYEQIRGLLAGNKLEGIAEIAESATAGIRRAMESSPEGLKADLKGMLDSTEKLKHAKHIELEGTRRGFGEVSRYAIRIVARVPALEQNHRVFKCLMWNKGYAKWIQAQSTAANPYTGLEMLECGSPSDWKE